MATPNFVAFVPSCRTEMCHDTKGHEVRREEITRRISISQNLGSIFSLHNQNLTEHKIRSHWRELRVFLWLGHQRYTSDPNSFPWTHCPFFRTKLC